MAGLLRHCSASVLTTTNTGSKSGSGNGSGSGQNSGHKGYQRPPPGQSFACDNLCHRYNANVCPNQSESRCKVPGTDYRLFHLCNCCNSNNVACRKPHTAADHYLNITGLHCFMPMFCCLYNLRQYTIFSIYPFFTRSVSKIIKFISASICAALGYPAWPILAA